MNRCARSGYLVDATSTLPTDATDLGVEGLPVVGCSNIRCQRCGATVRNVTGIGFRTRDDVAPAELAALYGVADLASAPLLAPTHPDYRLYLCRCSRWLESSHHACDEPDPDVLTDPQLPWGCAGHPAVTYPHDLDGVPLASIVDVRDLAQRGFHGFVPPRARAKDVERGNWIARLRARLDEAGQSAVDDVASAAFQDADPHTRALAVMYLYNTESEPVARHVVELLAGDRSLYAGVPDDVTPNVADKTLEESMWRALRPLIASDDHVCDLARVEALSGRAGRSIYSVLAKVDSDWVIANCADIARAAGNKLELLDKSLSQLPPGSPLDAVRQRIREAASQPATKEAVARRTRGLAERIRDGVAATGAVVTLYEPLPGMGRGVELEFAGASDTERVIRLHDNGVLVRELKRGTTIEIVVFLESDVTPDRIRDALKEHRG